MGVISVGNYLTRLTHVEHMPERKSVASTSSISFRIFLEDRFLNRTDALGHDLSRISGTCFPHLSIRPGIQAEQTK